MRKCFISILVIISIIACKKGNDNDTKIYKISDGIYMGNFVFNEEKFWCEICFDSNKYEEYPSGGVIHYQKELSCLTMGKDSIVNNILSFKLDSFIFKNWPESCSPEMLLPGNYRIVNIINNDSVIFTRGSDNKKITYYLKKIANM